jgi:histidinol phosphatase-like PHP family hydrolase
MNHIRLSAQEIVEELRRLGIPEYEMDGAVASYHKWEKDFEDSLAEMKARTAEVMKLHRTDMVSYANNILRGPR